MSRETQKRGSASASVSCRRPIALDRGWPAVAGGNARGAPNPVVEKEQLVGRPSWTRKWQAPDPAAIASRGKRILAETLSQRGNRVVTNKQRGIRFAFLVMTNTWAIGRWVAYYGAGFS